MGVLALGVLWLNTLLIAAAALKTRGELGVLLASIAGRSRKGTVISGRGPNGALITRTVHQVGRAMTVSGPDRILFTESRSEVALFGGEVAFGAERITLSGKAPLLWLDPKKKAARALTDFGPAFQQASSNRGLETTALLSVGAGETVWLIPGELLSTIDPEAALETRRLSLLGFAVIAVLLCAGITAIALTPPIFGTISTIGGALGLAFFLLVQPAGVKVRNWARLPHEQPVSDLWQR